MNFVTSISLVVLGAMFLALLGWGSIRAAWRNCEGRRGVFAALAILAAVCSIVAQKPSPDTPTITVDALLRDVGCYATNNVFHAAVTNAPSYAGVDFSDCDLMVYARERASSDAASWFELTPRKKFSQQPADYAIENATNYNYMVYLNYVPPSPVHTNGVFELYGFVIENETQGEPDQLAAGFINSRAFLAPPTARDYIQDGLVAMWDGIENAGWGVHDASARTWKNLVGDIDLPLDDYPSQIYFTSNSLYTSNGRLAERQDAETIDGPITYEVCWVRVNKFNQSADTRCNYGQCNLDIFNGQFWHKTSSDGGIMSPVNGLAQESVPFTMSVVGTMGGSWKTLIPYVNATQISGSKYSSSISTQGIRIGSGWNVPISKHHNIRVYSRALSADEIQHNYKIDKERFNLP